MKYFVYIVRLDETSVRKVGVSNNMMGRLDALQNANPCLLTLETLYHVPDKQSAYDLEHAIHLLLAGEDKRIRGEWFNCSWKKANEAAKDCAKKLEIKATYEPIDGINRAREKNIGNALNNFWEVVDGMPNNLSAICPDTEKEEIEAIISNYS